MKIIWHRISIQTLLFRACLPTRQNGVENRDKALITLGSLLVTQTRSHNSFLVQVSMQP